MPAPPFRKTIAILPLGAHEYHGPHLPFETDAIIADGIAQQLQSVLPPELDVTFLPTERITYSIEHAHIEGTKTLTYDEAVNRWLGIAEELASQGIRKLILLNAHGGNSPLMTVVATEARVRFNMLCVATSWTRFGASEGVVSAEDKATDIHGGDIETSVMLALAPETVSMEKAQNFASRQSDFIREFKHLRAYGPHAFGWKMSDLNEQGAAGNASRATAEKGETMLKKAVAGLAELISDVDRFDIRAFDI
ncbi:creatininase family protein [Rhizobium sp. L1K21]|uniref:creatininase family protein n=1 Tax=Rhizobium sp. L1K21 TaxID=2954933 RepID=UPI0020927BAF|nr:creatininase family protein [Rhizobium sp. L1K21]MCO6185014.1 creatininase family protein [Rhizobium sp. L1K21]